MIKVGKISDQTFKVTVEEKVKTTHHVTVSPQIYQKLTDGKMPIERLVEASFEFLLQREPNTSILRSFDLPVIGRYFPEYEQTIRGMIGS
ncbi:MAG: hypothetical protein A2Z14_10865 [Chloroflexi bacterium RBG_16_48_8]|nr:MAG: hypothetical protein A2Z14_10865 [Chloroflexi bacterium RBG_16_48_8]